MSFSINSDVLDKLTSYCEERGCSRSWVMSRALEAYLAQCIEDKTDYEIGACAWKEFEQSDEKTYSAEDVFAEAGL